jgi:hypothetical protein
MQQVDNRTLRHRGRIICTIATVHFVLSAAMLFMTMASSMSRFDGAGPSDLAALTLMGLFGVLSFPLLGLFLKLDIAHTGIWGWIPFIANSLLWGWAAWRAIRFWRSKHAAIFDRSA